MRAPVTHAMIADNRMKNSRSTTAPIGRLRSAWICCRRSRANPKKESKRTVSTLSIGTMPVSSVMGRFSDSVRRKTFSRPTIADWRNASHASTVAPISVSLMKRILLGRSDDFLLRGAISLRINVQMKHSAGPNRLSIFAAKLKFIGRSAV